MQFKLNHALVNSLAKLYMIKEFQKDVLAPIQFASAKNATLLKLDGIQPSSFDEIFAKIPGALEWPENARKGYVLKSILDGESGQHIFEMAMHSPWASNLFDMIKLLKAKSTLENPYLKNISVPEAVVVGSCKLDTMSLSPCELFQIGGGKIEKFNLGFAEVGLFVDETVTSPRIIEKPSDGDEQGNAWMSICPSEISSIRPAIDKAKGKVLSLGLGLGYFPYMALLKSNVESVTVIEKNPDIIALFTDHILGQFPHPEKVKIIEGDAIAYLDNMTDGDFDYCFADIWMDCLAFEEYLKVRCASSRLQKTKIDFWIEKMILYNIVEFVWAIAMYEANAALHEANNLGSPKNIMLDNPIWGWLEDLYSKAVVDSPKKLEQIISIVYLDKLLAKKLTPNSKLPY